MRTPLLALTLATTACFSPVGKDTTSTGTSTDASSSSSSSGNLVTSTSETTATTTTPTSTTTGPGPTSDATDTTTTTGDPDTSTAATATTDPMTTTGSSSTTETDSDCGNGVVDGMEQCDEGSNNANNGPCTKLCLNNICGDALPCAACLNPVQKCDDGNLVSGDGCSDQCIPDARYVFVTKATYSGTVIGGIIGADNKCMEAADVPLLKGRMFRAWLSVSTLDAKTHVGNDPMPVVRTDGTPVVDSTAGLYSGGKLSVPIDRDEFGDQVAAPGLCVSKQNIVWTGTLGDGTRDDDVCNNWSLVGMNGLMGNFSATDLTWTNCEVFDCETPGHLYCIEVP